MCRLAGVYSRSYLSGCNGLKIASFVICNRALHALFRGSVFQRFA